MVEAGLDTGNGSGPHSKPASGFEFVGDRLRFTVELRPDETTIVSWKKLVKEATSKKTQHASGQIEPGPTLSARDKPISPPLAPAGPSSSRMKPMEGDELEPQAQAGPNRLSNVIERIERMYAGNGSSDEEDVVLDDIPDDDEYDTDDSFIDDAELNDYFQVDNSAIKHDGFFVNRGKLERIEPTVSTNQQPKKRRRKDITKGLSGSDDGHNPVKQLKVAANKGRKTSSADKNMSNPLHRVAVPNLNHDGMQIQATQETAAGVSSKKISAAARVAGSPLGPANVNAMRQDKATDQQKSGVSKNQNVKKESGQLQDTTGQRSNDKISYLSKSNSGKQLNISTEPDQLIQRKEKSGLVERFDLNAPPSRDPLPSPKAPLIQRKDGSAVRSKSAMLEKAIRELEKIVAESRPPSAEVQDPDNASQAVKRRLTPEIKQKLARVARVAQSGYGKISKDLLNRLMSIVGHLMQLRTLKRNLKVMASMGLSAKQEKDDRVQNIKQEVADMVNLCVPHLNSKLGQQTTNSDDFQEAGPEEREAVKLKYNMDEALENKMCELYDIYVERLEEHSGPPIRKLYEELAAMWPGGIMDTEGVKRAICRAKDRRKVLGNQRKDRETIRKRKSPKVQVVGLAANAAQASYVPEKIALDSRDRGLTLTNKPVAGAVSSYADPLVPIGLKSTLSMEKLKQEKGKGGSSSTDPPLNIALKNMFSMEKLKQDKGKGGSSSGPIPAIPINILPKKKVKKKPQPQVNSVEAQFRVDNVVAQPDERYMLQKHAAAVPVMKPALQPGSDNHL